MFGHDDHHEQDNKDNTAAQQAAPIPDNSLMHDDNVSVPGDAPESVTVEPSPAPDTEAGSFLTDDVAAAPEEPASPPDPPSATAHEDTPAAPAPRTDTADESGDDLLGIKQQALQELSPLVEHLEQTPEEEFRTTMMMIQASDNSALIKKAYAAAQRIANEKVRAQALLDIVNEINYFTSQTAAA